MKVLQVVALRLIALFVLTYGVVYVYLGYKFNSIFFIIIALIFMASSLSLFLLKKWSTYLIAISSLFVVSKAAINIVNAYRENSEYFYSDIMSIVGGDMIIGCVFVLIAIFVALTVK